MEYKLLKEFISELEIISDDKTHIREIRKNIIIDCLEIVKDIIYSINDVITIYDDSPKILWINDSCFNMFGFTPEEIITNGYEFMLNRVHPDDLHVILKRNQLFTNSIEYSDIIRIRNKNDEFVWIKQSGKVFKTKSNGKPLLFLGVSTNITEIVNAKDTINHLSNENKKLNKLLVNCKISTREFEILELIAEGFAGKQIGDKLNISFNTVRTHRNNIMRKLKINCTAGLVNYYREFIKEGKN